MPIDVTKSVSAILEAVGDDPDLAREALDAELAKDPEDQRSTLIEPLRDLVTPDSFEHRDALAASSDGPPEDAEVPKQKTEQAQGFAAHITQSSSEAVYTAVAGDPEKAALALEIEKSRGDDARPLLVNALSELVEDYEGQGLLGADEQPPPEEQDLPKGTAVFVCRRYPKLIVYEPGTTRRVGQFTDGRFVTDSERDIAALEKTPEVTRVR